MVSSLDSQDALSAAHAVQRLHRMFEDKWNTSILFSQAASDGLTQVDLPEESRTFFLRLAETHRAAEETAVVRQDRYSDSDLVFYHEAREQDGQAYLDDPRRYQAMILNRVPRDLRTRIADANLEFVSHLPEELTVYRSLLGRRAADMAQRMVPHDPFIEHQFLLLRPRDGDDARSPSVPAAVEKIITPLFHHLGNRESSLREALDGSSPLTRQQLTTIRRSVVETSRGMESVVTGLRGVGLAALAALIPEEWLYGTLAFRVGASLSSVLNAMGMPHHPSVVPFEARGMAVNPEAIEFLDALPRQAQKWHRLMGHSVPRVAAERFWPSLHAVLAISLTSPLWHPPFADGVIALGVVVNTLQTRHWLEKEHGPESSLAMAAFLAQEHTNEEELRRCGMGNAMSRFPAKRLDLRLVSEFYHSCCTAQACLLDFYEDVRFVVGTIQEMAERGTRSQVLLMLARDLVRQVLVSKTLRHEEARRRLSLDSASEMCMRDFANALSAVIADWERPT